MNTKRRLLLLTQATLATVEHLEHSYHNTTHLSIQLLASIERCGLETSWLHSGESIDDFAVFFLITVVGSSLKRSTVT